MSIMTNATATAIATAIMLDFLRATYKAVLIPAVDAGREIGYANQTTMNMLSEERFPMPTIKMGGKRVVSIFVLADFLIKQQSQIPTPTIQSAQTRKGRPPKSQSKKVQGSVS